jgi:chromosomal replication initiation ATPase DnaA
MRDALSDLMLEHRKFLLITTTNITAIQLPDLASRLSSSNRINIEQPDDELVKTLIFKLFSNYSVAISNEVINYLVKFLPRDFVTIINIVDSINQDALRSKRKITIPLVKEYI